MICCCSHSLFGRTRKSLLEVAPTTLAIVTVSSELQPLLRIWHRLRQEELVRQLSRKRSFRLKVVVRTRRHTHRTDYSTRATKLVHNSTILRPTLLTSPQLLLSSLAWMPRYDSSTTNFPIGAILHTGELQVTYHGKNLLAMAEFYPHSYDTPLSDSPTRLKISSCTCLSVQHIVSYLFSRRPRYKIYSAYLRPGAQVSQ